MARRYEPKQRESPPEFLFKIRRRRGRLYFDSSIAIDIPEDKMRLLYAEGAIPAGWRVTRSSQTKKDALKKPYGSKTGRRERLLQRNQLVYQTILSARAEKVSPIMIPDLVNGQLRMHRFPALSDSRIRAIVAKQKQPPASPDSPPTAFSASSF